MREQCDGLKARWENEKNCIADLREHKERREELNAELKRAERSGNLERAAEIRYGELVELEQELARSRSDRSTRDPVRRLPALGGGGRRGRRGGLAKWTGIPVSKMLEGEQEKLLGMEDQLRKRVVGQDEALRAVSAAVRRARAGLQDPESADRLVHLPRPNRSRQDRAGPRTGRVPLRRRARDGADRHE